MMLSGVSMVTRKISPAAPLRRNHCISAPPQLLACLKLPLADWPGSIFTNPRPFASRSCAKPHETNNNTTAHKRKYTDFIALPADFFEYFQVRGAPLLSANRDARTSTSGGLLE